MKLPVHRSYIGRFAPSPSGSLHFGSLVAALASYLDARAHQGQWLVRIEDIDSPRCVPGADKEILDTLVAHSLFWDREVLYQSSRLSAYAHTISVLKNQDKVYYCTCTRKMVKAAGGAYPGTCRLENRTASHASIRLKLDKPVTNFDDRVLGAIVIDDPHALEDTILMRRDGLYAYNLAVVRDDIDQGVTHVVRGSDLLSTTAAHLNLYRALDETPPRYAHLPVAATSPGRKLSKQNRAAAIDSQAAPGNLVQAMRFLNVPLPEDYPDATCEQLLTWATHRWDCKNIPKKTEIIVDTAECPYHYDH